MTTVNKDITFKDDGRNWKIEFTAHAKDGTTVLPLTSGLSVQCQIAGLEGIVLTLSEDDGTVFIIDEVAGRADIYILAAKRTEIEMVAGEPYWYEIVVLEGNERNLQATGQLNINSTVFTTGTPDPLVPLFRIRFSEFDTVEDQLVNLYIADATRDVDDVGVFLDTAERAAAINLLAAHYLQMRKTGEQMYERGSVGSDQIQSIRTGDEAITYMNPNAGLGTLNKFGFNATTYGEAYARMLRKYPRIQLRM